MTDKDNNRTYQRFTMSYRIEHTLLIISFGVLAVTGLAQRYHGLSFCRWFVGALGGVENVRLIHRAAVALTVLESIYHVGIVGYRVFVLRVRLTMLPGIEDLRAMLQALAYNLGLSDSRPLEGRYAFAEKMEYWALVWGMLVMGASGFMLWNPIATARFLPGEIIPAAKAAHGGEAVLAAAAILAWHFYSVHVKFFNKSMFTGTLTEAEMAHEHPLELLEIKAGTAERSEPSVAVAARRQIYVPAYLLLSAFMVVGFYYFMTFEETAIETVPPMEDVMVYAPLAPTPLPEMVVSSGLEGMELTWSGGVGNLFRQQCAVCHNGFSAMGGLDLTSYQATLAGGDSGLGVVPSDPHAGNLVAEQVKGDHEGQFSGDELLFVHDWIENGAPEN